MGLGLLIVLATAPFATGAADEAPFVVELAAKDGVFVPDRIVAPAGRRIKIKLRNDGRTQIEFENLDLHKEKVLGPGAHSFVAISPLRPGSYAFFDEFHPDTGRGWIVVKP